MKARWFLILSLGLVLCVAPAQALPLIEFNIGKFSGGVVTTPDNGTNIIADDVPLEFLRVFLKPGLPQKYDLVETVLDFNTVTNSISVTGKVPSLGINGPTVLMLGIFTSFTVKYEPGVRLDLLNATGPDTKDPGLLMALGIDPKTQFNYFGISFNSIYSIEADTYYAISTSVKNEGKVSVPEPGILILLGISMASIIGFKKWWKE